MDWQVKQESTDSLRVIGAPQTLIHNLLGWHEDRRRPGEIVCEDNFVNQIVLFDLKLAQLPRLGCENYNGHQLKDFQKADVQKMLALGNVLNRNPMGLGKTIEGIAYMKELTAGSALILCPKMIRTQWRDQIAEWFPEALSRVVIPDSLADLLKSSAYRYRDPIVILNYDKLSNEQLLTALKRFRWGLLVMDEAHHVKNPKSKRAIATKSLPAANKLALTGTPILNKPDDLFGVLNCISWKYSGKSYWNFVNYFCNVEDGFFGRQITGLTHNTEHVEILRRLMDTISVYNSIDVAMGKRVDVVNIPMSAKQKKLYSDVKKLVLEELPENLTIANGMVLTIRLRQITSWPGLYIQDEAGPKFEWIQGVCEDSPDKFLVFTIFSRTADALQSYLSSKGIGCAKVTGDMKESERDQNKFWFTKGDAQVLVGTIGAMGQGTDGLQDVCHLGVFLDRDWSPEIMDQCIGRLERTNQDNFVQFYILDCEKSFDRHVGQVNAMKAEDIRRALKEE